MIVSASRTDLIFLFFVETSRPLGTKVVDSCVKSGVPIARKFSTCGFGESMVSCKCIYVRRKRKDASEMLNIIFEYDNLRKWISICFAVVMLTVLLLTGLVGCSGDKERIVDPIPQAKVDLAPTDELILEIPNYQYFYDKQFVKAIDIFKKTYLNVNVIVNTVGDIDNTPNDQYQKQISNELMAGSGPDILITEYFQDLYKTMDTGAFLNLSSVIEQDEEFHMEEYNEAVMNAGSYKDGCYFIPITYTLPILISEQGALDAVGFDLSKDADFVSFYHEIAECLPKMQENPSFTRALLQSVSHTYVDTAGVRLVDYARKKILPDEASFKAMCEAVKPYWAIDIAEEWPERYSPFDIPSGSFLFTYEERPNTSVFFSWSRMTIMEQTPVLSAIHTMDGGLNAEVISGLAIRAGSTNQLNAWNFIKIMLSEAVQYGRPGGNETTGFPVNKAALLHELEEVKKEDAKCAFIDGVWMCPAVPWEEKEPYLALHDAITNTSFENWPIHVFFYECMSPYFEDKKSYDDCVAELKSKLTLYVSE